MTRMDEVRRRLRDDGPQPTSDLPDVTYQLKVQGYSTFNPTSAGHGVTRNGGGQATSISFLRGYHEPVEVVETWVEHNQSTIEDAGAWAVHQRVCLNHGDEWKAAVRDVLDASPDHAGQQHGDGETRIDECPRCGSAVGHSLAQHIRRGNCDA